ncbi:MAG TPA: class I SAM-dependent methyltransferase [Enhygromyxa sp.]|nr:class I SAM-dependent methyltransferase [Enhygromyxa sp.]
MLRRDDVGARRLRLVNDAYGPASRAVLHASGLREGARVVELGCGTGQMTRWLAEQVGPSGTVSAVDRSADQLEFARQHCGDRPWVTFHEADAAATGLAPHSFDLVFIRLLLMHVPEPDRVIGHARELLRPGGVLACEELVITSSFCYPPQPAQGELHRMALTMAAGRGCDFDIGGRLHRLMSDAGFEIIGAGAHQPTSATDDSKHIEHLSLRETVQFLRDPEQVERVMGVVDALEAAANDPKVVYGQSRMVQVWGRSR